ncbi:MAG TPA: hypothetical protein VIY73_08550 [Polyangiaceae bacterium]
MLRRVAPLAFLSLSLFSGCTCGAKTAQPPTPASSSSAAPPSESASITTPGDKLDPNVFSAPIAAARVARQDVVAGLVAAEGVVRVLGMAGGKPAWGADALTGVAWAPDAELHVQPAGDAGVALVWRGTRGGTIARTLVVVGPRGEVREAPVDVGAGFCATGEGLAWIDPHTTGPSRVMARRWSDAAPTEVLTVSPDRDPALACGDHAVVVLGDGDDDLTAATFVPGAAASKPTVAIRDSDFGDDDEREHDVYTVGDDLGLVRVGSGGAVALRDIPQGGAPTPWRRLKASIPADDDVVAVDGDADATFVVYTHDADDACPGIGSTAEAVKAIRVDRKTGAESVLDLAPADCDHAPGPFWVAPSAPGGATVGWVERATKLAPKAPPIAGVALRTWTGAAMKARHVALHADAVSDAGCDASGCSVAALVRPEGADGMTPETIQVVAYP